MDETGTPSISPRTVCDPWPPRSIPELRGLRPEHRLLIALASPYDAQAEIDALIQGPLEWRLLEIHAERADLVPAVSGLIRDPDAARAMPAMLRKRWRQIQRSMALAYLMRAMTLSQTLERFDRAGVPVIVLKGQGLADRFYEKPLERRSGDIDLLVPADRIDEAGGILTSRGYVPVNESFYRSHHFHIPYINRSGRMRDVIELHWNLSPDYSSVQFDMESWWKRARRVRLSSCEILVADPVDELIHLAWHAFNHGAVPLRDLSDVARVARLVDVEGSWEGVGPRARECGASSFIEQALVLCQRLWGVPDPMPRWIGTVRPPRWISRNLFDPRTVLTRGRSLWWPLRQICYWSLLPRERAGWFELVRRTVRDERVKQLGGRRGLAQVRSARALVTLGFALALLAIGGIGPRRRRVTEKEPILPLSAAAPELMPRQRPFVGSGDLKRAADRVETVRGAISVVVTCYNYGRYLPACLESIRQQSLQPLEIIVIDDGSDDETPAVLEPFLADRRITVIRQANQGQATAKNVGISRARGEFVAFIDADDLWMPDKLQRQVRLFGDPAVGVTYTRASYMDASGRPIKTPERGRHLQPRRGQVTSDLWYDNFVPFSSSMVRRHVLISEGGFDQSLEMAIDWDLWLRLSRRTDFAFVDEALIWYRLGHPGQMSRNWESRRQNAEVIRQRFLEENPGVLTDRTIRQADAYRFIGRAYMARSIDLTESSRLYYSAIRAWPLAFGPYKGLVRNALEWGLSRVR